MTNNEPQNNQKQIEEVNINIDNNEIKDKIKRIVKTSVKKFYSGNPENEIFEGTIKTLDTRILINENMNLSYEQLELAKQYIWEFNLDNKYIKSKILCCTNIKNKFSITEFMQAINTYLSYISIIRVFKSSIPNIYYIYLDFKNIEYCNIFYNTYQYSNINTIEDDYLIFDEVTGIEYEGTGNTNIIPEEKEQINKNTKKTRKFSYEYDMNNNGVEDIRICTICLEDITKKNNKKLKNDGLIYVLCGHVFHIECFSGLDDNKCPICRYCLSPYNFVTCEYCFQENDLWLCLVCGKIFCGEEGKSQNHRLQHYKESFHLYTQALGKNNSIIYDFSKGSPVHIWIQNTILSEINNNNNDGDKKDDNKETNLNMEKTSSTESEQNDKNINEISTKSKKSHKSKKKNDTNKNNKNKNKKKEKEPEEDNINNIFKSSKEKTEYIISEYNSIISSQLENQRYYFLNEFKRRENKYLLEKQNLEEEISKAEKELKNLELEEEKSELIKKTTFEEVKKKNNIKMELEKNLEKTEEEFKVLQKEKNIIDKNFMNKNESIDKKIEEVDEEIKELNQQLKELNIHINTLNRVEKSDPDGIKNASLGLIIDFSKSGNNTGNKKKKHHK